MCSALYSFVADNIYRKIAAAKGVVYYGKTPYFQRNLKKLHKLGVYAEVQAEIEATVI